MPARLAHTPRYDAWRESLRQAVAARGAKTALARFMAGERGQPVHTWQVNIGKIFRGETVLNSENLLAITAWMNVETTTPPKRRHGIAH